MESLTNRLKLRLRMASPRFVRKIYRIVRAMTEPEPVSEALPFDLVEGCRFAPTREDMVSQFPRGGKVAELGTYRGNFAREILNRNDPSELHIVDLVYTYFDQVLASDPRVTCHQGICHEVVATFPDGYFDWIYLDADHSYEGTLREAERAALKVRPGGFLVFNDFAHIDPWLGRYGVHRAAVDFALKHRWPLRWFAYERSALYDVALQRPQ